MPAIDSFKFAQTVSKVNNHAKLLNMNKLLRYNVQRGRENEHQAGNH